MGCAPSIGPPTAIKPAEGGQADENALLTADEKIKIKEVWVVVKQNNMKKLGEDIMERALKKSSTIINYWHGTAFANGSNNLTFNENESAINTDVYLKQSYSQHGYKILDRIDQIIMIMITRHSTTNTNDSILNESFQRIVESHSEYKITQNHMDVVCESFLESLKNLMDQTGKEWTIKHEVTWTKFYTLLTTKSSSASSTTTAKPAP